MQLEHPYENRGSKLSRIYAKHATQRRPRNAEPTLSNSDAAVQTVWCSSTRDCVLFQFVPSGARRKATICSRSLGYLHKLCNDASSSVKCVHGNLCNQCHEKSCAREQNHHQVVNLLILCACPDRKCAQNPAEFTDAINTHQTAFSIDQPNFSTSLASRWRAMKNWRRLAQLAVLQTFPAGN